MWWWNIFYWTTWVWILMLTLFVLWIFYGGQKHDFVGLQPLQAPQAIPINTQMDVNHSPPVEEPIPSNNSRKSVGEQLTYQALEELFPEQIILSGVRPKFLTNPETGYALELDCYLPDINLAVEYSGRQHYEFPNSFHSSYSSFEDQIYRDKIKRDLCDREGIFLIVIPYHVDMCTSKADGSKVCSRSVPRTTRYTRIRNYLYNKINQYLASVTEVNQNLI